MFVGKDRVVCFDVDETLIYVPDYDVDTEVFTIKMQVGTIEEGVFTCFRCINKNHVNKLIELSESGYTIVVWSSGGSKWAQSVIDGIKISDYVDICISKPAMIFDDLPVHEWIPRADYIGEKKY